MNIPKYRCHKVVGATKIIEATRRKDGSMDLVTEAGEIRTVPGYFDRCYRGTEDDRGYFLRDDDGYETWVSTERLNRDHKPLIADKTLEKSQVEDGDQAGSPEAEPEKPIQPKRRGRKKKTATAGQPSDN